MTTLSRHNSNELVHAMSLGVSPSDYRAMIQDPRFNPHIKEALGFAAGYEHAQEKKHEIQMQQAWLQSQLDIPRPEPKPSSSQEEKFIYSVPTQQPQQVCLPGMDFAALINSLVKQQKQVIRNHHKHNQNFTQQLSDVFEKQHVIYTSDLTHSAAAEKFQLMIHETAKTVFTQQVVQYLPRPEPGCTLDKDFKHDAGFQHEIKLETVHQHLQTVIQQFCNQHIASCEHKQNLVQTMTEKACDTYQKHMHFLIEMHQCNTHIAQVKLDQQAQHQAIQNKPLDLLPEATPQPKPQTPAEEFQAALVASNNKLPSFFSQHTTSKRNEEEEKENELIQSILYNRRMTPRPGQ